MTTKPKKVVIKKKAILATPEIEFKTTKEKGDAYEIFIKHYLIDTGNYKSVYLWKDVPEADLFACGIMDDWNTSRIRRKQARTTGILPDFGTDLLVKSSSGDKYSIVQCKHYDESRPLSANDLGTFLCMVMRYHKQVCSLVYSSSGFQNHLLMLEDNYNITYNELKFNPARYLELLNTIYKPDVDKENSKILIPYDYQLEAINALKGKDRTVCQLPCGCGKTLIAIKLCEAYKQNVIITPLKSYCEQNLDRFTSQMDGSYAMMIIDSDGDGRNIDKIQEFVKKNNKICLFATFKSVDIINALVNNGLLKDCFMVIDEFHNLSINDILEDDVLEDNLDELIEEINEDNNLNDNSEDEYLEELSELAELEELENESIEDNNTEMHKLLHSNARILFMSATPRLYGDDIGYSEDCDIEEEIFGNIDYKMPMHEAITSGKICDYMVYVPTLSIEKTVGLDKIQDEVDIHGYDKELVIKARFLIRGMMNNGSKRCIIYLQTQEECRKMNTILTDIGKNYFGLDINSNYLISDLGREERKLVLKEFVSKEGYNFICSVDILNECVDIPECDSIFIAYPSKSKIRNIQRVCRANRKDKKNVDKVARIYVWADDYKDDLVDFIGHLKEYDESFTFEKIKRVNVNGKMDAVMRIDDDEKENKKLEGLVVGVKGVDSWFEKLEEVKKFIDENGRRPNKEDNKYLNKWLSHQITNFNNQIKSMKDNKNYIEWCKFINDIKYSKYFINNITKWKQVLEEVKQFIDKNKKKPSVKYQTFLYGWIHNQRKNYLSKSYIMENIEIYNLWDITANNPKYIRYLKTDIELWKYNFECLKKFMDEFKARPRVKTNEILCNWINAQTSNYINKINNMKNIEIYNIWDNFVKSNEYSKYFNIDNQDWKNNLELLRKYIDENKKKPSIKDNKQLHQWMQHQIHNAKYRIKIMINENIYNIWNSFVNNDKYSKHFNNDNIYNWKQNLDILKTYFIQNNKRPDKNNKFIRGWMSTQIINFKNKAHLMANQEIYSLWNEFINDARYKKYFDLNKIRDWKQNFEKMKTFLDENKLRPTDKTDKKLAKWISGQIQSYRKQINIMKIEEIKVIWAKFIKSNEYGKYF